VLYLSYYLYASGLIVVIEANHLKSRAVYPGTAYVDIFGQVGQIECLQLKLADNLAHTNLIIIFHMKYLAFFYMILPQTENNCNKLRGFFYSFRFSMIQVLIF